MSLCMRHILTGQKPRGLNNGWVGVSPLFTYAPALTG
jgi:hypothetical protein